MVAMLKVNFDPAPSFQKIVCLYIFTIFPCEKSTFPLKKFTLAIHGFLLHGGEIKLHCKQKTLFDPTRVELILFFVVSAEQCLLQIGQQLPEGWCPGTAQQIINDHFGAADNGVYFLHAL